MINLTNFKAVLKSLGFEENGHVLIKKFADGKTLLQADFHNKKLIYPTDQGLIVNGDFTCNFTSNENFVVFECVHRLLEKGYKPEHIELEPKWKVGHGASGGRADILVKDHSDKSLLIIECKTADYEFKKEWENTKNNGGQLLTYAKQAGTTQYVCLYASDFVDNQIVLEQKIISVCDNEKLLEALKDKNPLSFAKAKALEVADIFQAWKETYQSEYASQGIFEADILPYQIGKTNYSTKDLIEINGKDIQSKYHEFATILRQHNVSGRENAFDKLVNLFLCKIVDEKQNPNHLAFNWKGIAYDNFFELQDRLQQLYQTGMKEFLSEEVTYINQDLIDDAFRFVKNDPDATKKQIEIYFRQLKFFTNNDFAFIDVHNENLFYQNSEILLKIVKMLQDIKLKSDTPNQFLGDLFEGFLDNGVKQSEGQFFTPMPIVKFILNALPLETLIKDSDQPPKGIDYACGAGHFLNELALQIKPLVEKHKQADIADYYQAIVGIEKEYRLSKVAKVSAFMYGQDQIDIRYADALGQNARLQDDAYSILVANPPYAVKGFLATLSPEERKAFELFKTLEKGWPQNNSIETFFIERAKQLLQADGVAAIILPSSILSNDSTIYTKTREILLKYFQIVAITEFGSQTFGKTGTNTITLFLRRKKGKPDAAEHWKNRVGAWFNPHNLNQTEVNKANAVYADDNQIDRYCQHLGFNQADYKTLLQGQPNAALLATEMLMDYKKAFDQTNDIKQLLKQKAFKEKSEEERKAELHKRFIDFVQAIEKDKFYFYVLANEVAQPVLVVKCPTDNKQQKQFLGYEWSSAKGSEGIKYLHQGNTAPQVEAEASDKADMVNDIDDIEAQALIQKTQGLHAINTPLYNPNDNQDPNKINFYIQQNFLGQALSIPETLAPFLSAHSLSDMLDFSRVGFNKQISLTPKKLSVVESKWPLVKLGEVCEILIGGTPSRAIQKYFTGENLWLSISEMNGNLITTTKEKITNEGVKNSNVKLIKKGTTLLSFKLSIGKTAIAGADLYTNEAIAGLVPISNNVRDDYLFNLFHSKQIDLSTSNNAIGQSLNSKFLKEILQIPLPPLEIQQQLVAACHAVDAEVALAKVEMEQTSEQKNLIINNMLENSYQMVSVESVLLNVDGYTTKIQEAEIMKEGTYPVITQSNNKFIAGYTNNQNIINDLPLILFGDHTCSLKFIDFPFIRGADGTKLLKVNNLFSPQFFYYLLKTINIENKDKYERHFKYLSKAKIPVPPIADQLKIVAEIEILESTIQKAQTVIDQAPERKKAIVQQFL